MQEKLNSYMKSVKTYHIEENTNTRNPELNLEENLKDLEYETNVDFIIISTGTNDISKLNLDDDIGDLTTAACDQAKTLVLLATKIAKNTTCMYLLSRNLKEMMILPGSGRSL